MEKREPSYTVGVTTMENSMEVPQKTKNRMTISIFRSSKPTPGHKNWGVCFTRMSSITFGCKRPSKRCIGQYNVSIFGGGSGEWVDVSSLILTSAEKIWAWVCNQGLVGRGSKPENL